jgi:hypothetical protein
MRAFLKLWFFLALSLATSTLPAQFGTPVMNGTPSAGEYTGNQYNVPGGSWNVTWDNNALYFGKTGGGAGHPVLIYLDLNPATPVNNINTGRVTGTNDWGYQPNLPFEADVRIYWVPHGAPFAEVSVPSTPAPAGSWLFFGDNSTHPTLISAVGGTGQGEFSLNWSFNGGTRPAAFNMMMFQIDNASPFVYHQAPQFNPTGTIGGIDINNYFYFTVPYTSDPTALDAFANESFTQHNGGNYNFNIPGYTLYDFTINDNSTNNNDNALINDGAPIANRVNLQSSLTINNDLFIGLSSLLLPAANSTPTITMAGSAGRLFNNGRLDANPNISSLAAIAATDLRFVFSGTTTLQPSTVNLDRYRLGDITIPAGGSLRGPTSGTGIFEVGWGTLDVDGTLDLYTDASNYMNFVTRGFVTPLMNTYFLTGGGTAEFHDFIVGTDSSRVRPVASATPDTLEIRTMGLFGVFGGFEGRNNQAVLAVCMCGEKSQSIGGAIGQTFNGEVTIPVLRINNNNGLNNANSGADVLIETYSAGTVDYYVDGALILQSGDLITRNGGACNAGGTVHRLTLRSGATITFPDSVLNDANPGPPSSHIEGPLRREVSTTADATYAFPVGKSGRTRLYELTTRHSSAAVGVYEVELNECLPPAYAMAPTAGPPGNEQLDIRPQPRHWLVTYNPDADPGAPTVAEANCTLHYNWDDVGAPLSPTAIRIIREDGIGGYLNHGGLTTTFGPGFISSTYFFTEFGVFSFGFPVVLESQNDLLLTASPAPVGARLQWTYTGTQLPASFRLQRKQTPGNWEVFSFKNASESVGYDPEILTGVRTYQVVALLPDGSEVASNSVELYPGQAGFQVQAQTANGALRARVTGVEGWVQFRMWNALGQQVWEERYLASSHVTDFTFSLPASAGLYWLEAGCEGKKVVLPVRVVAGN